MRPKKERKKKRGKEKTLDLVDSMKIIMVERNARHMERNDSMVNI